MSRFNLKFTIVHTHLYLYLYRIAMANYLLLQRAFRKERLFRDRTNPFDTFSDDEFRTRYRLSKNTTHHLIDEVRNTLRRGTMRSRPVAPEIQVLIFLRFLATGQFYTSLGDLHDGVNSGTVCRIIQNVSSSIAALHNVHIKMPENAADINRNKREFY